MGFGGGAKVAKLALAGGGGVKAKGHGESVMGWEMRRFVDGPREEAISLTRQVCSV
jgi:hypothetical protein